MDKKIPIIILFLILFVSSLSGCVGSIKANIIGTPTINTNEKTDIQLISEDISYDIHNKKSIYFNAEYVLKNPTNKTINQSILFDFYPIVPDGFKRTQVNGEYVSYDRIKTYNPSSGAYDYSSAIVNVTFNKYESIMLKVIHQLEGIEEDSAFTDVCSILYKCKNGNRWNGSIQYANFSIMLHKKTYDTLEISGFDITEEGNEIIAKKSYTNWIPESNITIKCSKFHQERINLVIIVFLATFILIAMLLIWYKKTRKNNNKENKPKGK